jgi:hypothetical protein
MQMRQWVETAKRKHTYLTNFFCKPLHSLRLPRQIRRFKAMLLPLRVKCRRVLSKLPMRLILKVMIGFKVVRTLMYILIPTTLWLKPYWESHRQAFEQRLTELGRVVMAAFQCNMFP